MATFLFANHDSATLAPGPGERRDDVATAGLKPAEGDLQRLADILRFLLLRDDDRPARWLSPAFCEEIAHVRSAVTTIANHHQLTARLGPDAMSPGTGRFEWAARRLAADATAVGLAIRWLEIELDTRLPTWSSILRRQALRPAPVSRGVDEAPFWFG